MTDVPGDDYVLMWRSPWEALSKLLRDVRYSVRDRQSLFCSCLFNASNNENLPRYFQSENRVHV